MLLPVGEHPALLGGGFAFEVDLFIGGQPVQLDALNGVSGGGGGGGDGGGGGGGGGVGGGVYFHFGDLLQPSGELRESVVAEVGLTVQLLTRGTSNEHQVSHVEIDVNGKRVQDIVAPRLTTGTFERFIVRLSPSSDLYVEHASRVLIDDWHINGLEPAPAWVFGLSASTDAHATDFIAVDNIRAARLGSSLPGNVTVGVTVNSREYYRSESASFEYYKTPVTSSVSPSLGPVHGGTTVSVRGSHLAGGPDMRCKFSGVEVPATLASGGLLCRTPALYPAHVDLCVTMNGQDYDSCTLSFLAYVRAWPYRTPRLVHFERSKWCAHVRPPPPVI